MRDQSFWFKQAVTWYRLAALQGDPDGKANLSAMYFMGQGVSKDYALGHMWLNLSAAGGSELGRKNRDLTTKMMTGEQIAQSQKLAREWKPTPAGTVAAD